MQFRIVGLTADQIERAVELCNHRGLGLKWFGRDQPRGFTSRWSDWGYTKPSSPLEKTDRMLGVLCDLRVPLEVRPDEARAVAEVLRESIEAVT